ncbi:hypothetical protein LINPERPRIM_LOCUS22837 [Linum perenne]
MSYNYLQPYYSKEASYSDDSYGYTYTCPPIFSEVSSYTRAPPPPPPHHPHHPHHPPRQVAPTRVGSDEEVCSGNVDRIAEEFIKMEHKQWSKNMSSRFG